MGKIFFYRSLIILGLFDYICVAVASRYIWLEPGIYSDMLSMWRFCIWIWLCVCRVGVWVGGWSFGWNSTGSVWVRMVRFARVGWGRIAQ